MNDFPSGISVARASVYLGATSTSFFTTGSYLNVPFDTEEYVSGVGHTTSNAARTGTVSVTSGSPTVTGSGTSFTTELAIGDAIAVDTGTSTQYNVVTAIASNTSLTCSQNFTGTVSGKAIRYARELLVITNPGVYFCSGQLAYGANTANTRKIILVKNTGGLGQKIYFAANNANATVVGDYQLAVCSLFDFFALQGQQDSGSSLDALGGSMTLNCHLKIARIGRS